MKYKPFEQGQFKYELGLTPLELRDWIEIDEHWPAQRKLKAQLFRQEREKVFQTTPVAEAPAAELMQLLAEHLARYYPKQFVLQGSELQFIETKESFDLNSPKDHPLAVLSQWVQEDFCLMNTTNKEARLEAGSVCFPSKWKLIEKVGHNMAGIHTPVPGFNKTLEKPSTRFLLNTLPDKPMWRMNWSIHASDNLFAYESEPLPEDLNEDNILERTYFRVERQTLRRLPQTGFVVFTIRTYLTTLLDAVASEAYAGQVLKYLETLPQEVIQYRSLQGFLPQIKAALAKLKLDVEMNQSTKD